MRDIFGISLKRRALFRCILRGAFGCRDGRVGGGSDINEHSDLNTCTM